MKILIYTHAFAPKIGGTETYVMLLAQGLAVCQQAAGTDLQVTVATPTQRARMNDDSLPFHVAREPSFLGLAKLVRKADVVHVAGPCFLPMLLGLLLRKRVTAEHHGYPPVCPNGLLVYEPENKVCPGHFMAGRYRLCLRCNAARGGWLESALKLLLTFPRRWLTKRVHANICITNHVKQRLRLPRASVIYYGITDCVSLRGPELRLSGGPPQCFAYVGRLVSLKGLPLLVEAAQRLKDQGYVFCLKFIGDGPERSSLEKLVDDRGLRNRTTFAGNAKEEALEDLVRDATAVVMPSIWEETAGLAAIEQMMRGKLVIASDIGGLGEVVGDAGLRFPAGDAAGLAECMRCVLNNPDIVGRLGSLARRRALALFGRERMVGDYVRLYRRLTEAAEESGRARGRE